MYIKPKIKCLSDKGALKAQAASTSIPGNNT